MTGTGRERAVRFGILQVESCHLRIVHEGSVFRIAADQDDKLGIDWCRLRRDAKSSRPKVRIARRSKLAIMRYLLPSSLCWPSIGAANGSGPGVRANLIARVTPR